MFGYVKGFLYLKFLGLEIKQRAAYLPEQVLITDKHSKRWTTQDSSAISFGFTTMKKMPIQNKTLSTSP